MRPSIIRTIILAYSLISVASIAYAAPETPRDPPEHAEGPSYYRLQLKVNGNYLDAAYCSDHVVLSPGRSTYAKGACQLWRLEPAGNGWYRLQLKVNGNYLDAAYCSNQVVLSPGRSTYAKGACQLWRLVPDNK
jgi:hypothetical protein